MTFALLAVMTLCQPQSASMPQASGETMEFAGQQPGDAPTHLSTFYPVCRDGRGSWDRRACRHLRRNDPARLLLV